MNRRDKCGNAGFESARQRTQSVFLLPMHCTIGHLPHIGDFVLPSLTKAEEIRQDGTPWPVLLRSILFQSVANRLHYVNQDIFQLFSDKAEAFGGGLQTLDDAASRLSGPAREEIGWRSIQRAHSLRKLKQAGGSVIATAKGIITQWQLRYHQPKYLVIARGGVETELRQSALPRSTTDTYAQKLLQQIEI